MKEKSLTLSSEQKDMVFKNMSDGIITVSHEGIITYVNEALLEILNFTSADAILNKNFKELFSYDKKNHAFHKLFDFAFNNKISSESELIKYRLKNGQKKFLSIKITLLDRTKENYDEKDFPGMFILIEDMTDKFTLRQREHDYACIFAGIIFCITIYLMAFTCINYTLGIHLKTAIYTLMIEIITFFLFIEILFFTSFSLRDLGIIPNIKKWRENFTQTISIGAVSCAIIIVSKVILALFGIRIKNYFIGGSLAGLTSYAFTSLLQEFLARGVIQTSVKSLLRIKHQRTLGIIITSLLFSLMHMPFGFIFMMGAFVLSVALGYIFEKQGDLWGCVFLHWLCGYLTMCLYF